MKPLTILILEDSGDRIEAFERAVRNANAPWEIKIWHEAPTMIAEYEQYLPSTALISLDHDLVPRSGVEIDPGDGFQVARHLAKRPPHCPVIIHTSNQVRRLMMHKEFVHAGWRTELIVPGRTDWIETDWIRRVRSLLNHPQDGRSSPSRG
jgi:CheY-like chemotaxis protein